MLRIKQIFYDQNDRYNFILYHETNGMRIKEFTSTLINSSHQFSYQDSRQIVCVYSKIVSSRECWAIMCAYHDVVTAYSADTHLVYMLLRTVKIIRHKVLIWRHDRCCVAYSCVQSHHHKEHIFWKKKISTIKYNDP